MKEIDRIAEIMFSKNDYNKQYSGNITYYSTITTTDGRYILLGYETYPKYHDGQGTGDVIKYEIGG